MTAKRLCFRNDAREKILRGVNALTDAVAVTLGPKSKCVLIDRKWGVPLVCNDGVTIAKELEIEDPDENLGVKMLRQAAERTGDAVGDGTSTATILAQALFSEGLRNVVAGASAIEIKRGLDQGAALVIQSLRSLSKPVTGRREKEQVATISAHNDASIGAMVADAVERVGGEGVITVEEAKGIETSVQVVEGMQFDRGYLSPYFVNDTEKMQAILQRPRILLCDRRIGNVNDLVPLLEAIVRDGRSLLVIAEEVEGEALATLVVNKIRGTLQCAAVKAPAYGDRRREMQEDIAVLTGGKVLTQDLGITLGHVKLEDLGSADRVSVGREETTIVVGHGDPGKIAGRIQQIRKQIDDSTSDYDREKLHERLSRLSGGVAVIRVGAPSEAEMKSRKEAFEDAISSTKAAVAEGIVPGGGLALLRAITAVESIEKTAEGDLRTGLRILARALEAPARKIAENSGVEGGVVVQRMRDSKGNIGFDAARCIYVDLLEAGIVDPTKVVRSALENAVSVAGVLLLTEATLTENRESPKEPVREVE